MEFFACYLFKPLPLIRSPQVIALTVWDDPKIKTQILISSVCQEGLTACFLGVIHKQCCRGEITLFSTRAGINMVGSWAISLFLVLIEVLQQAMAACGRAAIPGCFWCLRKRDFEWRDFVLPSFIPGCLTINLLLFSAVPQKVQFQEEGTAVAWGHLCFCSSASQLLGGLFKLEQPLWVLLQTL